MLDPRIGQVNAGSPTGNPGVRPETAKSIRNRLESSSMRQNPRRKNRAARNRDPMTPKSNKSRLFMKYPG
ncbi:MAG: hypothetical protein OXH59_02475 [Rhodospirillaceae bacterium]|nr:hypothetical protein [Rhodospirillaceae bacterium]